MANTGITSGEKGAVAAADKADRPGDWWSGKEELEDRLGARRTFLVAGSLKGTGDGWRRSGMELGGWLELVELRDSK